MGVLKWVWGLLGVLEGRSRFWGGSRGSRDLGLNAPPPLCPIAEFLALCPDGRGFILDEDAHNYGVPAHRGQGAAERDPNPQTPTP